MAFDYGTYQLGMTQLHVGTGLSQVQEIAPAGFQNGGFFKISHLSGNGTLAIVNALGASWSTGYLVGSGEVVSFSGPARFFLAAATATMTVAIVQSFSAGYSLRP